MDIDSTVLVFLDTETTGDAPYRDKIIELSAVKVKGGELIDEFDTLIDPEIAIPEIALEVSGITEDMVRGKPKFAEVADAFLTFLGSDVIVAHNADFDRQFINHELMLAGKKTINNAQFCTVKMARRILPRQERYSLEHLAESLRLDKGNSHRALDDTKTSWQLFRKMTERMKQKDIGTMEMLREIQMMTPAKCRELYFPREEAVAVSENQNSLF